MRSPLVDEGTNGHDVTEPRSRKERIKQEFSVSAGTVETGKLQDDRF